MNLPVFFINRPVFATILNIVILVVGLLALKNIHLREYPDVTIPEISVEIRYPNASAEVIESEITFIAENELANINGLKKIKSSSGYGEVKISLQFLETVDFSQALSDVREKIAIIRGLLPKEIKEPRIIEGNNNNDVFYYISITNPDKSPEELAHFSALNISSNILSIPGVASAQIWGAEYTMRIIIDRAKLYLYKINIVQVLNKLKMYSTNLPGGKIDDSIPITINIASNKVEDFAEIVITNNDSGDIKLKDIAEVKLEGSNDLRLRVGGKPAVLIAVIKTINSNPLEVSNSITQKLETIRRTLPKGYTITTEQDTSDFIRASLYNVETSIIEAIILVILIVFLFLRNVKAAFIPLITIPICLAGSVAILNGLGFSLNILTLLAMVLSIGLVVDDAIVILENIYKHIEQGKTPLQAAKQGSREIGFAVVAMTFTLTSVFIPVAIISGEIGKLFIEFAVTLAGSVIISGVVALTLSPMLAAKILKKSDHNFLPSIDILLHKIEVKYQHLLAKLITYKLLLFSSIIMIIIASGSIYYFLPQEAAPKEDRGVVGLFIPQLPNISLDQLDHYSALAEDAIKDVPEIDKLFVFNAHGGSQVISKLKPWSDRKRSAEEIRQEYDQRTKSLPSVQSFAWSWDNNLPGVELDHHGGEISFIVKTTANYQSLIQNLNLIVEKLKTNPLFQNVSHRLQLNNVAYELKCNQHQLSKFNIIPQDISSLLAISFGDLDIEEFQKDGRVYHVNVSSLYHPKNIDEIYIFDNKHDPISLGSLAELEITASAKELDHYNKMRASKVDMMLYPNVTFDQALDQIIKFIKTIDIPEITIELSNNIQKFKDNYYQTMFLMMLSIFFIYAILAIQFESFIDPLVIIFAIPLGFLGALLLTMLSGNSINIFSQIGIITLIGLISKHSIMIVDFANKIYQQEGISYLEAVIRASASRLRPILMTTFAMVFGSIPLILSTGAGAEARNSIGYVLIGGLTLGTLFTLFIIPFIYVSLKECFRKKV